MFKNHMHIIFKTCATICICLKSMFTSSLDLTLPNTNPSCRNTAKLLPECRWLPSVCVYIYVCTWKKCTVSHRSWIKKKSMLYTILRRSCNHEMVCFCKHKNVKKSAVKWVLLSLIPVNGLPRYRMLPSSVGRINTFQGRRASCGQYKQHMHKDCQRAFFIFGDARALWLTFLTM